MASLKDLARRIFDKTTLDERAVSFLRQSPQPQRFNSIGQSRPNIPQQQFQRPQIRIPQINMNNIGNKVQNLSQQHYQNRVTNLNRGDQQFNAFKQGFFTPSQQTNLPRAEKELSYSFGNFLGNAPVIGGVAAVTVATKKGLSKIAKNSLKALDIHEIASRSKNQEEFIKTVVRNQSLRDEAKKLIQSKENFYNSIADIFPGHKFGENLNKAKLAKKNEHYANVELPIERGLNNNLLAGKLDKGISFRELTTPAGIKKLLRDETGAVRLDLGLTGNQAKSSAKISSKPIIPQGKGAEAGLADATSPLQKAGSGVLPQAQPPVSTPLSGSNVKSLLGEQPAVSRPQSQVVQKTQALPQLPKSGANPSGDIISNSYNYNKLDQAYTESLDRFHPISKLGKTAKKNDVIQNALTGHYGSGSIAKYHLDFELAPILKSGNANDLRKAAIMQRDIELAGRGIKGSGQGIKMKITPEIQESLNKLYKYQDDLVKEYLVKTGIMTDESFKAMKANNQSYVPFKRVMDQVDEFLGIPQAKSMGSVGSQNVIKKIKGSDREIVDPIDSIIENTYKVIGLGQRQKVARAIVSIKDDLPEGLIREFKGETIGNNPVISLFENGKVKKYSVPREVEEAAKGLNEDQLGTLVKILSAPTKVFRASATTLNPEFMVPNVARDMQSAFVNVGLNPLRFVSGVAHFIKKDKVYQEFLKSGGMTSFTSLDRKFFKQTATELSGKGVTIKKPSDLLRVIQNVATISEQPTRIAAFQKVYDKAIKTGKSVEEARSMAAYAAQEATVNFARRGSKTQSLNAVFAFLNARMQGIDRTARSLKKDPVGAGTRLGLVVMAPGMATYAWNQQFPEYYDERIVTKNDKQNNFIIMLPSEGVGGARFVKIPKGDIGKMFNPVEAFMDYAKGRDTDVRNAVDSMIKGFSPVTNVGDLVPTALRPLVEDKANKNFFFDSPIVSEYQKKDEPRDQFRSFTPSVYRMIGDKTNLSPARLQNAVEGYGTGWAKIGSNVAEKFIDDPRYKKDDRGSAPINTTPIVRRFLGGPKYSEEEYKKIDAYKKREKVEKEIGKTGNAQVTENEIYYEDSSGDIKTINLAPPTKGEGIDAFTNQNWKYTKAREVFASPLSSEQKKAAYKKLGVSGDIEYDYKASKTVDVKTQFLVSKDLSHDELIDKLIDTRKRSLSGKIYSTDGVINNLVDMGYITKEEGKALKNIDYDKNGKRINKSGGKKLKKLSIKAASAPKYAKLAKSESPKMPVFKNPKKPTLKNVTATKPKQYKVKGFKNSLTSSSKVLY